MQKHVLVMAASVFPRETVNRETGEKETRMPRSKYVFKDPSLRGRASRYEYEGYYQLEPIPMFIRDRVDTITDIVLLQTVKARRSGRQNIYPAPDHSPSPWPGNGKRGTAVGWFKAFLQKNLPGVTVHDLPIDEHDSLKTLESVMTKLQELYAQTENPEEWRLWFDTHGGFRDTFVVVASAARLLMKDEHRNIMTHGVYSVYYSQDNEPSEIVNQTAFYFTQSADALKYYLNYGQFLVIEHVPYAGYGPYAFISYRHGAVLTGVRAVFSKLEEAGVDYWFDDGIKTGEAWAAVLKEKIEGANAFIALLSKSYFDSPFCWKEFLHAVARAKTGDTVLRVILLEEGVRLPETVPADERFAEAALLQKELGLTDADLHAAFSGKLQYTQLYKYLPGNKERQVNERNLVMKDRSLLEDFKQIAAFLRDEGR